MMVRLLNGNAHDELRVLDADDRVWRDELDLLPILASNINIRTAQRRLPLMVTATAALPHPPSQSVSTVSVSACGLHSEPGKRTLGRTAAR